MCYKLQKYECMITRLMTVHCEIDSFCLDLGLAPQIFRIEGCKTSVLSVISVAIYLLIAKDCQTSWCNKSVVALCCAKISLISNYCHIVYHC